MLSLHNPLYMAFVSELRAARTRSGVTQQELASRLGVRQSYIAKVETCERRIDVVEAAQWCMALSISFQDVLPLELQAAIRAFAQERGR